MTVDQFIAPSKNITANEIIKSRIALSSLSESDRECMIENAKSFCFTAAYDTEWTREDRLFWAEFMKTVSESADPADPAVASQTMQPADSRCQIWDDATPVYLNTTTMATRQRNKALREYYGHNGDTCKVVVKRNGDILRYGSPDASDRSKDFWHYVGDVIRTSGAPA